MKHEMIGGKLLNLEKTWKHLSKKQKDWICQQFRDEYTLFVNNNKRHPNKNECDLIVQNVYEKIEERDIWIPFVEVRKAFSAKLTRYRKINVCS